MEGLNGTVFAYGQTASGKTYSMVKLIIINNKNINAYYSNYYNKCYFYFYLFL